MSNAFDAPSMGDLNSDPAALARKRIQEGREARRPFEKTWLGNIAFVAGKHYYRFDRYSRTMMLPPELEADMHAGNLYSADVITERRMRVLSELSSDDDRPELLLVDEGETSGEDFQGQLNRAVGFCWDHEVHADEALGELRQKVVDLGTAAVQVVFDPSQGKPKGQAPFKDGKPVLDPAEARSYVGGMADQGQTAEFRDINEGRLTWRVLSPFNLLVPPGVENEKDFNWVVVMRPVPLEDVKGQYPLAKDLVEDTDIASTMGLDTRTGTGSVADNDGLQANTTTARLRDHVWVFTYYENPTPRNPQGRTLVLAGNEMRLLTPNADPLPFCAPDGTYRHGIAFFHWWRVTGRFWSRALVEPMKDIQRRINKRTNQIDKTIDRGQAFVIVDKNGAAAKRKGWPMEILALEATERQPIINSGTQPGQWMYADKQDALTDLDHASGVGEAALGSNPASVNTYSQLALLNEQEQAKRSVIRREHDLAKARLVEDTVHGIRTYWGHDKQILLDGDDNKVQARVFDATKIPAFFIVKVGKGTPKPRSQAAELQKVSDIWNAALASLAMQQNPGRWVKWFHESMEQGQTADLPEEPNDAQTEKAELENHLMNQGEPVGVAYYDSPQIHVPLHRDAQTDADMAGDETTVALIEQHIQAHIAMAKQVAERQAEMEAQTMQANASANQSATEIDAAHQPPEPPSGPQPSPPAQ